MRSIAGRDDLPSVRIIQYTQAMKLKVLSWNIWGLGDFKKTIEFLKDTDADVIALQEVVPHDPAGDVYKHLTEELGYAGVYGRSKDFEKNGQMLEMGNAVFSRLPIRQSAIHPLSKSDPRVAVRADIEAGGQTLHVFSTHFSYAELHISEIQQEQAADLIALLPAEKTIVMGDFNAAPQSVPIQQISAVLRNVGDDTPTWNQYPDASKGEDPAGLIHVIDYIFASKDVAAYSYSVGRSPASDHLPISAIVELASS